MASGLCSSRSTASTASRPTRSTRTRSTSLSWSWGMQQPGTLTAAAAAAPARSTCRTSTFVTKYDKASPKLINACCNGKHLKKATLTCRKAGKDQLEYLKITMNDVHRQLVSAPAARRRARTSSRGPRGAQLREDRVRVQAAEGRRRARRRGHRRLGHHDQQDGLTAAPVDATEASPSAAVAHRCNEELDAIANTEMPAARRQLRLRHLPAGADQPRRQDQGRSRRTDGHADEIEVAAGTGALRPRRRSAATVATARRSYKHFVVIKRIDSRLDRR